MSEPTDLERTLLFQLRAAGVATPEREHRFLPDRRFRFDLAWPDRRVAVEIEGGTWVEGRHSRGKGYEADCEKQCLAVIAGWRLLRVTGDMVTDGRALRFVEFALAAGTVLDPAHPLT